MRLRAAPIFLILSLAAAGPALADAIRLGATSDAGVTLELPVQYRLEKGEPADAQAGRLLLVAPGLGAQGAPGRPILPSATALIALPPGARAAVATIEGDEEMHEGVRLTIGEQHGIGD